MAARWATIASVSMRRRSKRWQRDSTALLAGQRELRIRHGSDTYRLRLTASGKLILTK